MPNDPVPPKMEDKIPSNEQSSSSSISIKNSPANPSTDIKRIKTSDEIQNKSTPMPVSPVPLALGVEETQDSLKIRANQLNRASPDIDVLQVQIENKDLSKIHQENRAKVLKEKQDLIMKAKMETANTGRRQSRKSITNAGKRRMSSRSRSNELIKVIQVPE